MAFDNDRDSCACGQVVLDAEGGLVVVEDLEHGPIACLRHDPGH